MVVEGGHCWLTALLQFRTLIDCRYLLSTSRCVNLLLFFIEALHDVGGFKSERLEFRYFEAVVPTAAVVRVELNVLILVNLCKFALAFTSSLNISSMLKRTSPLSSLLIREPFSYRIFLFTVRIRCGSLFITFLNVRAAMKT